MTPLIPNAREAGFAYYRKTGIYPVNHGIVIRNAVLAAQPTLADDLFNTFAAAKKIYGAKLDTKSSLTKPGEQANDLAAVVGG